MSIVLPSRMTYAQSFFMNCGMHFQMGLGGGADEMPISTGRCVGGLLYFCNNLDACESVFTHFGTW